MTERRLTRLFEEYNTRFFGGRIPSYRVRLRVTLAKNDPCCCGLCDIPSRVITISRLIENDPRQLRSTLLHEMVHALVGVGHGKRFFSEIRRLDRVGAPTLELEGLEPDEKIYVVWKVARDLKEKSTTGHANEILREAGLWLMTHPKSNFNTFWMECRSAWLEPRTRQQQAWVCQLFDLAKQARRARRKS